MHKLLKEENNEVLTSNVWLGSDYWHNSDFDSRPNLPNFGRVKKQCSPQYFSEDF